MDIFLFNSEYENDMSFFKDDRCKNGTSFTFDIYGTTRSLQIEIPNDMSYRFGSNDVTFASFNY